MNEIKNIFKNYFCLMRFDKPIGIFLLLWPTLTALWIAQQGIPTLPLLIIFTVGVLIMRPAGCILNDLADRNFDKHVSRTQQRPLAAQKISIIEAIGLAVLLFLVAFYLVLKINTLALVIAVCGAFFTLLYPFAKRVTNLPQIVLGVTWNLGILMAFAATTNSIPVGAWFLYAITFLWTVMYDTQYAMADREEDIKIGVHSTAILFANADRWIIGCLQIVIIFLLIGFGLFMHMKKIYFFSLIGVAELFIYQQFLIFRRDPKKCLRAFKNNNRALLILFGGVVLNYL